MSTHLLQGHADGVVGLSWSHDGSSIATASDDRAVRVFNLTDLTSRNINIKRKALLRAPVDVCFGATAEQLLVLTKGVYPGSLPLSLLLCKSCQNA